MPLVPLRKLGTLFRQPRKKNLSYGFEAVSHAPPTKIKPAQAYEADEYEVLPCPMTIWSF